MGLAAFTLARPTLEKWKKPESGCLSDIENEDHDDDDKDDYDENDDDNDNHNMHLTMIDIK